MEKFRERWLNGFSLMVLSFVMTGFAASVPFFFWQVTRMGFSIPRWLVDTILWIWMALVVVFGPFICYSCFSVVTAWIPRRE